MKKLAILFLVFLLASPGWGTTAILNAFNSGELSPLLEGRTDVRKYYSGCRTLENMVVLPYGGVTKRPGSHYIAAAKSSSLVCRVIPFEHSILQAYVIELGNLYARFYKDGGQITSSGSAYEITTTYETADLFELQFVQSADVMYLAHSDYPPRYLTRTGHTSWTITDFDFQGGPFLDENTGDTTITPSATTGSITLTASAALFNANHVGALWCITHTAAAAEVSGSFTAVGNSSTTTIQNGRKYDLTTHGTWTGTILLQRSYDAGSTYKDVISFHNENDGNISFSDSESIDDALYRVRMSAFTSGTCKYNFLVRSFDVDGIVDITAYTSTTVVTGTVKTTLGDTAATKYWAEGAWSPDEGYPSCVTFYEERLVFAATTNQPQTMWFSQTNDWDNFLAGADDTDAMSLTIAADQVNAIHWMVPQTALLLGTTGGEWALSATGADEPLTPTNVGAKRQSNLGSAYLQAQSVNNQILFVQRQGRKIRQLQYSFELDNWVSPDLTLLSEHITGDGVVQLALQKTPYPILWCVREDGALIGLTLEETHEVIGWHRHEFGGDVESIAVIPGDGEDEIWLSVERTIDSSTVRYIEQLQPFDWGDDQEDCFFVDSGLTFDGGASQTITSITQANPAVVTVETWLTDGDGTDLADGDQVRITGVAGMVELNNNVYTVDDADSTALTFSLDDADEVGNINSTGFTLYTSGGTVAEVEKDFSGLDHLENETITLCLDGGHLSTKVVADGEIELTDYYNTVHAGLAFTSKLQPMKLQMSTSPGALFSITKRITEVTLRFYKTLSCDIGTSWSVYDSYVFRDAADPLEAVTPLYTGDKTLDFAGDYETAGDVYIQSRFPTPLTVLALVAEFEAMP